MPYFIFHEPWLNYVNDDMGSGFQYKITFPTTKHSCGFKL